MTREISPRTNPLWADRRRVEPRASKSATDATAGIWRPHHHDVRSCPSRRSSDPANSAPGVSGQTRTSCVLTRNPTTAHGVRRMERFRAPAVSARGATVSALGGVIEALVPHRCHVAQSRMHLIGDGQCGERVGAAPPVHLCRSQHGAKIVRWVIGLGCRQVTVHEVQVAAETKRASSSTSVISTSSDGLFA